MQMKVYVISLENSKRRCDLKQRLEIGGIADYEVVDAQEPHISNSDFIKSMTNGKLWSHDDRQKNESRQADYISHIDRVLIEAKLAGEKEILILEDDVVFKSCNIFDIIDTIPNDSLLGFFDTTKLEYVNGSKQGLCCGWEIIDDSKLKVCCAGCYLVKDVNKVVDLLLNDRPKVYGEMLTNIQEKHPCYVYLPSICEQSRRTCRSDIE